MDLIEVRGVRKVFSSGLLQNKRTIALDGIDLSMGEEPEILTLAGESGSGKTTLARIILGLTEPTEGTVRFQGRVLRKREVKEHIQPIFQNPYEAFNPFKTVEKYLSETERALGKRRIDDALKTVELDAAGVLGKYPHELSGGQLQRLAIARALIASPRLLIADEPVSMVDASLRMSVLNFFKRLKSDGVSIIYITHDLATAYYISDRICVMFRGNIVEMGNVEEVLERPLHPYTQLLLESIPSADPVHRHGRELKAHEIAEKEAKGCLFASRCEHATDDCSEKTPPATSTDGRIVRCFRYSD